MGALIRKIDATYGNTNKCLSIIGGDFNLVPEGETRFNVQTYTHGEADVSVSRCFDETMVRCAIDTMSRLNRFYSKHASWEILDCHMHAATVVLQRKNISN